MGKKSKYTGKFKQGDQFGSWTVVDGLIHNSPAQIDVTCTCGTARRVDVYTLVKGKTTSCGCQLKNRTGERNPNWKGVNGISATTLYKNSVSTGLSYQELTAISQNQNNTCYLTNTRFGTSGSFMVAPIDITQPISVTNAAWVNTSVASVANALGVKGTITMTSNIQQTLPKNIFDKLGMKPVGEE